MSFCSHGQLLKKLQTSLHSLFYTKLYVVKIRLTSVPIIIVNFGFSSHWTSTSLLYTYVHSVQQNSIGQKFSKSRTGSDVRYSCHHNLSCYTFPIFTHSWCFSVFHSLQSITHHIYEPKTTVHLLNLKLKH